MIPATDLRSGVAFLLNGAPYVVLKYTHTKLGRGNATIRVSARNLKTGSVEEKTFNSGATIESIATHKKQLQYLYEDSDNAVFMDPKTYEQVEIDKEVLGQSFSFLQEGQEISILFWESEPLSVDLPPSVTLKIAETDPGVKGNSATNVYKSAKLDNGLQIKVPLFIKQGDRIRVDTRTGEYIERAK